jgi:hypothetical protein
MVRLYITCGWASMDRSFDPSPTFPALCSLSLGSAVLFASLFLYMSLSLRRKYLTYLHIGKHVLFWCRLSTCSLC